MKPHDFQVSNCFKNRGKIGWELTFIMTNMKPNPFGRYHIKVPLDSGPRSPSTLTSISGNGVNSRINHPPFPDCCPFGGYSKPHQIPKNWIVVFVLLHWGSLFESPSCPILRDESPWNSRLLQDVFAVGVKVGVPHLSSASISLKQKLTKKTSDFPPVSSQVAIENPRNSTREKLSNSTVDLPVCYVWVPVMLGQTQGLWV